MSTPDYEELEPEFGEVMALLRDGLPDVSTERPSEGVWDAIAAELGPTVSAGEGQDATRPAGVGDAPPDLSTDGAPASDGASVRSITSARSWGRPLAMITGAAAALLVGIPLFLASRDGDDPSQRAELAALGGFDGSGQAEVEDGSLNVRFDGSAAPDGAFYELWLLDLEGEQVEGLQSLGRIEVAADGSYAIPDGIDLGEFDVVDVSLEPDDGDPTHSGASVLRGGLTDL